MTTERCTEHDRRIIELYLGGKKEDGFQLLCSAYTANVRRVVFRRLQRYRDWPRVAEEAEDLITDALLRTHKSLESRDESNRVTNLGFWVWRNTQSQVTDFLKDLFLERDMVEMHQRPKFGYDEDTAEEAGNDFKGDSDFEARANALHLVEAARRCAEMLTERAREIVTLRMLEFTLEEISIELQGSSNTNNVYSIWLKAQAEIIACVRLRGWVIRRAILKDGSQQEGKA